MKRSKEQTIEKLLQAMGSILKEEGYRGLGVNKVARRAGVSKKLLYRYFGGFDGLLEAFLSERDFWTVVVGKILVHIVEARSMDLAYLLGLFMEKLMDAYYHDEVQRQLVLWSIDEPDNPLVVIIIENRERSCLAFFNKIDQNKGGLAEYYKSLIAVMVAGVYHMSVYARIHCSSFCGFNFCDKSNRTMIKRSLWSLSEKMQLHSGSQPLQHKKP